ncbi:hypothetical protein [uncultured Thalassospira sp.]|uniref:hypothetical protein n=1 Tax=uncultured Thalassospira sp. TaxID=404382 RepID=UPI0030D9DCEC
MTKTVGASRSEVPDWPGRTADDAGHNRIAAFLVLDIQHSAHKANYVRDCIIDQQTRAAQAGGDRKAVEDMPDAEIVINAYALSVGAETSVIDPVVDGTGEGALTVATKDLLAALECRIATIGDAQNNQ